jgi:hypothetical protein
MTTRLLPCLLALCASLLGCSLLAQDESGGR